jgi:sarcosine oxidase subunit gamma
MDGSVMEQRDALSGRADIEVLRRLSVRAAPDCARFSLRVGSGGREAAGRILGVPLPARIGQVALTGGRAALCLGPDEWSIVASLAEAETIRRGFAALGEPHSLVDTSHRDVGIELLGPAVETALAACCTLDLASMPAGSVTRTILDKSQVVLVKHGPEHYRVEVWQSFAEHVWNLLRAVSREIALDL